jgi:hypothetical protein
MLSFVPCFFHCIVNFEKSCFPSRVTKPHLQFWWAWPTQQRRLICSQLARYIFKWLSLLWTTVVCYFFSQMDWVNQVVVGFWCAQVHILWTKLIEVTWLVSPPIFPVRSFTILFYLLFSVQNKFIPIFIIWKWKDFTSVLYWIFYF